VAEDNGVNPQTENGFIMIALEIWGAWGGLVLPQDSERALRLILRLSYGCKRQKFCKLPSYNKFGAAAGIDKSNVKKALEDLETKNIIVIDWEAKIVAFNKHYDRWQPESRSKYFDKAILDAVVKFNLSLSKDDKEIGDMLVKRTKTVDVVSTVSEIGVDVVSTVGVDVVSTVLGKSVDVVSTLKPSNVNDSKGLDGRKERFKERRKETTTIETFPIVSKGPFETAADQVVVVMSEKWSMTEYTQPHLVINLLKAIIADGNAETPEEAGQYLIDGIKRMPLQFDHGRPCLNKVQSYYRNGYFITKSNAGKAGGRIDELNDKMGRVVDMVNTCHKGLASKYFSDQIDRLEDLAKNHTLEDIETQCKALDNAGVPAGEYFAALYAAVTESGGSE